MATSPALVKPAPGRYDLDMIGGSQIRAARALLRWSTKDLAERAGVGIATVHRAEAVDDMPGMNVRTLSKLKQAFESAGVIFLDAGDNRDGGPGVRLR